MPNAIAVIGSVNIDIGGYPLERPVPGDSTPGRIRLSIGGVGGNIARNLARLGMPVRFLTTLGGDPYAEVVARALEELDIDLSLSQRIPGENTSTYLFIADERGDMRMAISDMGISRHQTPEHFGRLLPELNACRAVLFDANLSEDAIAFLAQNVQVPMFADAVSAAKAHRLMPALPALCAFKPNRIEAEILSGVEISDLKGVGEAAKRLLGAGVGRVFITLGADGVYCADGREAFHMPAFRVALKNATGAGDAFSAAMVWAWAEGRSLGDTCLAGNAAAAIAAESEDSVSERLSAAAVEQRIHREAET